IIARYQQLSRLELTLSSVDLNALVTRVLALQHFANVSNVDVKLALDAGAPRLNGDTELLASALENLVKNAFEAMPQSGTLTVSTALFPGDQVRLLVNDTGA